MSAAVFITVPKYVAITPMQTLPATGSGPVSNNAPSNGGNGSCSGSTIVLPKIQPAPAPNSPATTITSGDISDSDSGSVIQQPRGKKRRLDHLTWEEKIQRKKLKNRVAAQTSRDRKKARMEEMEHEIKDLTQKTEILVNKCESLQVINDSLLEKNQKLDMEVELLRQQLQELQKQQQQQQHQPRTVTTCAGCESLLNGSAAGLKPQGLSVDTGANRVAAEATVEKEHHSLVPMACDSSLPALQDMLLPDIEIDEGALDDAEFDAGKLEELAESLLADITADLEASDRASNAPAAQVTGGTERLSGSVVGTAAECLESSQHTIAHGYGLSNNTTEMPENITSLQTPELTLESKLDRDLNNAVAIMEAPKTTITSILTTASTAPATVVASATSTPTPDTVYGTYDAKTNSITVVMDDVAVPCNEAVEEIYCDGATAASADEMLCSPASPSQVYLNVTTCSDDEDDDDFNFDPIAKFLCPKRPLVSPLGKSPAPSLHSATSDHGYESIMGSPTPPSHYEPLSDDLSEDFGDWPPGFNELFPTLI